MRLSVPAGSTVWAGVPSGTSTGTREAVELRDGDLARCCGMGVLRAVGHVNGEINQALARRSFADLAELDGTDTRSRLGADAIVGVSMAAARAFATAAGLPRWQCLTPCWGEPAATGAAVTLVV